MRAIITNIALVLLIVMMQASCTPKLIPLRETPINSEKSPISSPSSEVLPVRTEIPVTDNTIRDCLKLIRSNSNDRQLAGSLIVNPLDKGSSAYLLDLQDGSKKTIARILNIAASPNKNLLAYNDLDLKSIVITKSTGDQILEIANYDESLTPRHWLNNQQLLLEYRRSELGGAFILPSLVILNVFTGEKQELLPDYPNLDTSFSPVDWSVLSRFLPNADQSYVVYQARDEWIRIVLWDVSTKHEVASVFNGSNENTPWWSNDGIHIITSAPPIDEYQGVTYVNIDDNLPYARGADLFTISVEGDVKRLTYFSVAHFALQSEYVWSPDDKRIAFLSQVSPPDQNVLDAIPELSVVDIETGNVSNLCLPGYGPIWSPDGKYIAINQGPNEQREQNEAYIIDLENGFVWKIVENAEVIGWIRNEP